MLYGKPNEYSKQTKQKGDAAAQRHHSAHVSCIHEHNRKRC